MMAQPFKKRHFLEKNLMFPLFAKTQLRTRAKCGVPAFIVSDVIFFTLKVTNLSNTVRWLNIGSMEWSGSTRNWDF